MLNIKSLENKQKILLDTMDIFNDFNKKELNFIMEIVNQDKKNFLEIYHKFEDAFEELIFSLQSIEFSFDEDLKNELKDKYKYYLEKYNEFKKNTPKYNPNKFAVEIHDVFFNKLYDFDINYKDFSMVFEDYDSVMNYIHDEYFDFEDY